MNIFGLGPLEILLIVVLALIVFGPARLPEIMGQVGKAIADFRRATSSLSDEFNRTIQAELAEGRSLVEDTKSTVTGVHSSITSAIGTAAPTLTSPAPAQTVSSGPTNGVANNGSTATTDEGVIAVGAGAGAGAGEKPPLANTAQWSWETAAPAPDGPVVETRSAEAVPSSASATGAALEEPAVETVTPISQPAAEPARRRSGSRRDSGRGDLLPPY
jgi:TatA/E family protein of Tat protein translocase